MEDDGDVVNWTVDLICEWAEDNYDSEVAECFKGKQCGDYFLLFSPLYEKSTILTSILFCLICLSYGSRWTHTTKMCILRKQNYVAIYPNASINYW